MRIAIDPHTEVGIRTGKILLAERKLKSLGIMNRRPRDDDPRLQRVETLTDWDLLVSDNTKEPELAVQLALSAEIGCVLSASDQGLATKYGEQFALSGTTLLLGANIATGITPSLATHKTVHDGKILGVTIGWTEQGKPLRRGKPIQFPDPVGARWAAERRTDHNYKAYVAPGSTPWTGAVAQVTSTTDYGIATRVVGVADSTPHLEALALAAGVLSIDTFTPGAHQPTHAAKAYLAAALQAGLAIAAYSTEK